MLVCGNGKISPNECDAIPPQDIDTTPLTHNQADSISDVYKPSKGAPHPYNANYPSEEYGFIS